MNALLKIENISLMFMTASDPDNGFHEMIPPIVFDFVQGTSPSSRFDPSRFINLHTHSNLDGAS